MATIYASFFVPHSRCFRIAVAMACLERISISQISAKLQLPSEALFGMEEWKNAGIDTVQEIRRIVSAKHRNRKHRKLVC
jgi:hypothetical protein